MVESLTVNTPNRRNIIMFSLWLFEITANAARMPSSVVRVHQKPDRILRKPIFPSRGFIRAISNSEFGPPFNDGRDVDFWPDSTAARYDADCVVVGGKPCLEQRFDFPTQFSKPQRQRCSIILVQSCENLPYCQRLSGIMLSHIIGTVFFTIYLFACKENLIERAIPMSFGFLCKILSLAEFRLLCSSLMAAAKNDAKVMRTASLNGPAQKVGHQTRAKRAEISSSNFKTTLSCIFLSASCVKLERSQNARFTQRLRDSFHCWVRRSCFTSVY